MTPPSTRRRRRGSGPIRCDDCHLPVDMLTDPYRGHSAVPFDQRQVDGRTWTGGRAHPVEGRRAWLLRDLVEDLMVRRHCTRSEAEIEAYAMPWQPVHRCASADDRRGSTTDPRGDQHP